jgi:hypothetical protein
MWGARFRIILKRERPRPECIDELSCIGRQLPYPVLRIAVRCQMHDDGMVGWPPFRRVDARDGRRILGVAAEAIDGFGRKRDELAGREQRGRFLDLRLGNRGCRGGRG